MKKKQLPWNLLYPGHSTTPTIVQSPYSFAQIVSLCATSSSHRILEHPLSVTLSTPFFPPSSSSGFLAILPSLVTISLIKQPKKPPPSPPIPFFLFLSLALFKSLTRQFVTLPQHTNGLLLSTNIDGLLGMQNRLTTEEMTS